MAKPGKILRTNNGYRGRRVTGSAKPTRLDCTTRPCLKTPEKKRKKIKKHSKSNKVCVLTSKEKGLLGSLFWRFGCPPCAGRGQCHDAMGAQVEHGWGPRGEEQPTDLPGQLTLTWDLNSQPPGVPASPTGILGTLPKPWRPGL